MNTFSISVVEAIARTRDGFLTWGYDPSDYNGEIVCYYPDFAIAVVDSEFVAVEKVHQINFHLEDELVRPDPVVPEAPVDADHDVPCFLTDREPENVEEFMIYLDQLFASMDADFQAALEAEREADAQDFADLFGIVED